MNSRMKKGIDSWLPLHSKFCFGIINMARPFWTCTKTSTSLLCRYILQYSELQWHSPFRNLFQDLFSVLFSYPPQTKNQKKSRANAIHLAQEDFGTVPHSFVFHRGQIGKNVSQLIVDMRRVMEPYTAESLKVATATLNRTGPTV